MWAYAAHCRHCSRSATPTQFNWSQTARTLSLPFPLFLYIPSSFPSSSSDKEKPPRCWSSSFPKTPRFSSSSSASSAPRESRRVVRDTASAGAAAGDGDAKRPLAERRSAREEGVKVGVDNVGVHVEVLEGELPLPLLQRWTKRWEEWRSFSGW